MVKLHKTLTIFIFLLALTILFRPGLKQESPNIIESEEETPIEPIDLWNTEPTFSHYNSTRGLWWLRNQERTETNVKYRKYTSVVGQLIRDDDPLFQDYYVNKYVNAYNNTVFMVITDDSPEILTQFNEKIPVPNGVKIVFRTSPYSYVQLTEWITIIHGKKTSLESKGVELGSLGVSENGTILTGIYNYTDERGRILVAEIETEIPKGILTFRNATRHGSD